MALLIGHRISVDFDLFCNEPIKKTLLGKLEALVPDFPIEVLTSNESELTVLVDRMKFTFGHYPFPPTGPLVEIEGVSALGVTEIGVSKAYTIGRRGEYKDYIDMYFLLSGGHTTLEAIITGAKVKYGEAFNDRLFLEQLVYFDDVKTVSIEFLLDEVSKEELLAFFKEQVRSVAL